MEVTVNILKQIYKDLKNHCKNNDFLKAKEMIKYYLEENNFNINRMMLEVVKLYETELKEDYNLILSNINEKVKIS